MGFQKDVICSKCNNTNFTARLIGWDDYTTRIVLTCMGCGTTQKLVLRDGEG